MERIHISSKSAILRSSQFNNTLEGDGKSSKSESTVDDIKSAENYYFIKGAQEVKQFLSKSKYEKFTSEKDGMATKYQLLETSLTS